MLKAKCLFLLQGALAALMLGACAGHGSDSKSHADGGVDGSGGNLSNIQFESFQTMMQWQGAELRDVVHRLYLVRKNTPEVFSPEDGRLVDRLIGPEENAVQEIISKMRFEPHRSACSSSEGDRDAAVTPEGAVCLNYEAFKRFQWKEVQAALLPMTLHELSHLRGLDEAEAVKIQGLSNQFQFTKSLILNGNETYETAREAVGKAYANLQSVENLLSSGDETLHDKACSTLNLANWLIYSQMEAIYSALPKYLFDRLENNVLVAWAQMGTCGEMSNVAALEKLIPIEKEFRRVLRDQQEYELSFCADGHCDVLMAGSWGSGVGALLAQSRIDLLREKKAIPQTDVRTVECEIKNLTENKVQRFDAENEFDWKNFATADVESFYILIDNFDLDRADRKGPQVRIGISNTSAVSHIAETVGFAPHSSLHIDGFLQKGSVEKISAKFSVNKERIFYDSKSSFAPFKFPAEPVLDVELNCQLKP